jgi:hypothetical protein
MLAFAYTLLACLLPAALAFSPSFPYGSQKVRGVSLGGWLLIEVRMLSQFFSFPLFLSRVLPCVFNASFLVSLLLSAAMDHS